MLRSRWLPGAVGIVLIATLGSACGGADAGTTPTLHWYTAPQNGGSFDDAAAACTKAADGRYRIVVEPLPADASQQREQLVRRLAANDSAIDLISMDVVWTAEFAEAGWVRPWPRAEARAIAEGVIPAVLTTGRYRNRMYAAPLNTGSQVLFYRKDRVPEPPKTWDEMLETASRLPEGQRLVQVQGARYEGFTVWVNSLIASAGGQIVDERGRVALERGPTRRALQIMNRLATSSSADPSLSNNKEDEGRIAYQSGRSSFMVNYTNLLTSIEEEAPDVARNTALAPWPAVDANEPAHVTLGGFNLGVGAYGNHPRLAFEAARCLSSPEQQIHTAETDGLPPVTEALYDDPRIEKTFPFADLLLETFRNGSSRPVTPAYNDVSLAVQRTLHPPAGIDPRRDVDALRDRVDDALSSRGLL
jgi:multiple sugar transport system substrate-binding protein